MSEVIDPKDQEIEDLKEIIAGYKRLIGRLTWRAILNTMQDDEQDAILLWSTCHDDTALLFQGPCFGRGGRQHLRMKVSVEAVEKFANAIIGKEDVAQALSGVNIDDKKNQRAAEIIWLWNKEKTGGALWVVLGKWESSHSLKSETILAFCTELLQCVSLYTE